MVSCVEIYDLEEGNRVTWQIGSKILSKIHDLERDEEIMMTQAMMEERKTPQEIMDEIDKEFGFL